MDDFDWPLKIETKNLVVGGEKERIGERGEKESETEREGERRKMRGRKRRKEDPSLLIPSY